MVYDSIQHIIELNEQNRHKSTEKKSALKLIVMNSAGVRNTLADAPLACADKALIATLKLLLPPHADNERTAQLCQRYANNPHLQTVVVRPDTLIDTDSISPYQPHTSPTRSALFNPGQVSRTNVAHFMWQLLSDSNLWQQWAGKMPVLYSSASELVKSSRQPAL